MRILYFSDGYGNNVMGTKRSIQEELVRRGHAIIYQHRSRIPDILKLIKTYSPDQVWLAHSFILLSPEVKKKAGVPVVGFGFSDPYNFVEARLNGYTAYITNHFKTFEKYQDRLPVHYNPTACDFRFHRNLGIEKNVDASFIGIASHPHFKNKIERIEIIERLRRETAFKVEAWGQGWPDGKIEGMEFLTAINRSRIGLDIQDEHSPLAHRMFEYAACGIPVITRKRLEVEGVFLPGEEILTYSYYEDLRDKLNFYLIQNPDDLERIGFRAMDRCFIEHDIKHRVDGILSFLEREI